MTIHTHDSLDHEEAKLLVIVQQAARHATPDVYRVTRSTVAKRFAGIDVERRKLLQGAK
jgi:hypothetical protein